MTISYYDRSYLSDYISDINKKYSYKIYYIIILIIYNCRFPLTFIYSHITYLTVILLHGMYKISLLQTASYDAYLIYYI